MYKMQMPEISFSFLSTQTCTNCQLPVTCAPVYVINDLSIICGRCKKYAKDHYRNYAYEALASTFIYPCKNWRNHCPVKLRWNDSLDHEQECNYVGCCSFCCSHPGAFFKGKRHIPQDESKLTIVPDNLLEDLECVNCRGYLNNVPVHIQTNGQNVCHRCIYANGAPPNTRRNYSYENFSQIFLFPCTNKERGCRERFQFGRQIWKHEAKCEYARVSRTSSYRLEPRSPIANQPRLNDQYAYQNEAMDINEEPITRPKERGVIKTHSGHYYGTITPAKALFAPPENNTEEDNTKKKLLKSLAKKQGRNILKNEIEMGRRYSESESLSTNESYSIKTSGNSTPDILESSKKPYYIPAADYNNDTLSRPDSRESGYQSHQKYLEEFGFDQNSKARESIQAQSQFPVLYPHQLSDGFDSIKRISRRESGRNLLINELKLKQDFIKRTHSIKNNEAGSLYKQCNTLEDIREVNNRLR
ncbi:unnamed protein product [Ceutorhynchus assimilis]|uniref:Uncharacterized protein n=1 Tax=Ceutorhynchus assimilis TaxID=467358 RepID=A0A9N9QEK2_9CUCU|nr:unnamed protein product [Ceutorhynchus assimilis]